MRPRRFEYLISYKYYHNNGNTDCTYLFNSRKDVLDLMDLLKEKCNAHTVIINNSQLLREKRAL
ncbi:hypothetical protein ORM30_29450 [Bacillus cereus]|uniref:hypothetical protein n=1 Tax=Bacillus sp. RB3 TaxID=3050012 RepID=UPI00253FF63B|nr:hypothetical protein [Bacillus sp. RB3]MDK3010859.1 hypothetical protein [Bacillus sp. RB3]MDZ4444523.1 hypothetical protein [Bacillus cereus]